MRGVSASCYNILTSSRKSDTSVNLLICSYRKKEAETVTMHLMTIPLFQKAPKLSWLRLSK